MRKVIGLSIPEWLVKTALTNSKNKSERVVELMTKGLMFEQQEQRFNLQYATEKKGNAKNEILPRLFDFSKGNDSYYANHLTSFNPISQINLCSISNLPL